MNLHRPNHPWRRRLTQPEFDAWQRHERERRERNTAMRLRDEAVRAAMRRRP